MPGLSAFILAIHGLSAVVWVGGMFFAYMFLRPALSRLEPPQRLQLWADVFERFFIWVWIIIIALPLTGYVQIFYALGGFENIGPHIRLMHILGWVMVALFIALYFLPYRLFRTAVAAQSWPVAAGHLNYIRRIVATNMVLGLIVVIIGSSGRYWG